MAEKVMRFQGKNGDLTELSHQISKQLEREGYKAQMANPPMGVVIGLRRMAYVGASLRPTARSQFP